MVNVTSRYDSDYFDSGIFQTDYRTVALAIFETYQPKTMVEFGCGPGHLSRELAKLGVQVTAVDGYARPDFSPLAVEFHPLDLNNPTAIANLFTGKSFDLAVSVEVAEHLEPQVSSVLVSWLTKVAPVVVFSAGVPGQGGQGHINLRPRDYWHNEFTQHGFAVVDSLRQKLRNACEVAPWYRYNVLDYVHKKHPLLPDEAEVIHRLVASESAATTAYFNEGTELSIAKARLNSVPVKYYLALRQLAKGIVGRGGK